MKIDIPSPCTVNRVELQPIKEGYFCTGCNKKVIDYSNMTDAQVIEDIQINGFGCGEFNEDQLNRELVAKARKKSRSAAYLFAFFSLLTIRQAATAQAVNPDTVQAPCKKVSYDKIENRQNSDREQIIAYRQPAKRLGTGHVSYTRQYKTYGIFWRKLRIPLFKVRK